MKKVVLVDLHDQEIGTEEKIKAHKEGLLHRAFSVFVVNGRNELLIQQRSAEKYHSPLLWTNTCCSHPESGEDLEEAAHKRLLEEMGFDCTLHKLFQFKYRADFENGLTEHEIDHVYLGIYNADPKPDHLEVNDWKWEKLDALEAKMLENPENYTYWFKHIYGKFYSAFRRFDPSAKTNS